jgi:hypothetical protein
MNSIIALKSQVLIDRSQIRSPYLRLVMTALGKELARGSPWVAVNKEVAIQHDLLFSLINHRSQRLAA